MMKVDHLRLCTINRNVSTKISQPPGVLSVGRQNCSLRSQHNAIFNEQYVHHYFFKSNDIT